MLSKASRLSSPTLLAAATAVIAAVAFVAGAPGAHAESVAAHDFVGAKQCQACHQAEYEMWSKGPHARALVELRETERKDQRCIQCHTMVPQDPAPEFAGVQCETCHGPGRYYGNAHVMRDAELRKQLMFEEPSEKTCKRCHTESSPALEPFDYAKMLGRIRHWADKPADAQK